MINRKMKKDIENHGRNAKKKKKRKNQKGEDGISIRSGNANQNIGGGYFNSRFPGLDKDPGSWRRNLKWFYHYLGSLRTLSAIFEIPILPMHFNIKEFV